VERDWEGDQFHEMERQEAMSVTVALVQRPGHLLFLFLTC